MLLTNIVMTWNKLWLQRSLEEALAGRGPVSVEHVTRMASIGHQRFGSGPRHLGRIPVERSTALEPAGTCRRVFRARRDPGQCRCH